MEAFVKGDVVVLPFPFSDLSASKRRPALVISPLKTKDIMLMQITSKDKQDGYSILLNGKDFSKGSLKVQSFIRSNRLFTADTSIVVYKVGKLKTEKIKEVEDKLIDIIRGKD